MRYSRGNATTEYVICLVFFLIILLAGDSLFNDGSILAQFKQSYENFYQRFSALILNLDVIP